MARTTRSQLEGTLSRLASSMGVALAAENNGVGLMIDYAECYGGYKIIRKNADTTESDVFGSDRCSAGELWGRMAFAIQVLGQAKR